MASTLWLVRHGHRFDFAYPDWFTVAPQRYDPPLSAQGFQQVEQLSHRLAPEKIDHLFCSPFLRTLQTGYLLAEKLDLPIKIEPGLGEWLNADWMTETPQTVSWEQLSLLHSRVDPSYRPYLWPQFPETETAMLARFSKMAQYLTQEFDGALLIVGHSATVRGIITGLGETEEPLTIPVASLCQCVYHQGKWQLTLPPKVFTEGSLTI